MAPATPARQSGRSRKPNPKYTADTITDLSNILGSDSEPDPYYLPKVREPEDDGDFDIQQQAVDEITPPDTGIGNSREGDLSMSEADAAGASDGSGIATPYEDSEVDGLLSDDSSDDPERLRPRRDRKHESQRRSEKLQDTPRTHSRGYALHRFKHKSGGYEHWKLTFGGGKDDLAKVVRSRDQWADADSVTLPSKRGLRQNLGKGAQESQRQKCGWYESDEGKRFRKRQRLERLDTQIGRTYLPDPDRGKEEGHSFLMGPWNAQKKFHVPHGQSMNFADAWPSVPGVVPAREGWLLNVGRGAQAMAWAPMPPRSTRQYLAVAVPSSKEEKDAFLANNWERKQNGSFAFTPAPPTKSSVQIWEFRAKKDVGEQPQTAKEEEDVLFSLDMSVRPKLRLAIMTEWGDPRRLAWCPSHIGETQEANVLLADGGSCLGLLAGIWADGKARILDVRLSDDVEDTEYGISRLFLSYQLMNLSARALCAPFELAPPTSIFTALSWFSSVDLGLATAHGSVAIFDVPSSDSTPATKPYFYHQIHTSYILAIASAAPDFPHLLASTSMDGFTCLTDLRSPLMDQTNPGRNRLNTPDLAYVPSLKSMVYPDENGFIRFLPLRRFFSGTNCAKASADITSLATSTLHPCVLAGSADGHVTASNGLRRLIHHSSMQYQQCWFVHDYSPTGGKTNDGQSISRFVDGFKAEKSTMNTHMNDGFWATIWEEGGHVTALSWNENAECGGWAAASMGCGLIRVEDVSI